MIGRAKRALGSSSDILTPSRPAPAAADAPSTAPP